MKKYLKAFTSEQLQAAVTPQQATPLFVHKLLLLSRHIQRKMGVPDVAAVSLPDVAAGSDTSTVPHSYARSRNLSSADLRDCEIVTRKLAKTLENFQMCSKT